MFSHTPRQKEGNAAPYQQAALAKIEDLYKEFNTGSSGLAVQEAAQRLFKTGPNVLPEAPKTSLATRVTLQLKNLFNVLLFIASALSFASGILFNDQGSTQMGATILAVIIINIAFSLIQEYRAEKAVQVIHSLIPNKAKVIRDNQTKEINAANLVPGDILILEEGDRVPADLRLTSAFEVSVNNAVLTGESEPQRRFATMQPNLETDTPYELHDIIFAGTTLTSGVAKGVVLFTGKDTEFGRIVSLSSKAHEPLSSLEQDINYTAKINFLAALAVAAIFFTAALLLVKLGLVNSILFAIGIMISLVPEGFQLTISLSLALTALKMAKRNTVVKRLSSVETAGQMSVLCVDKTGTITSGEMMIKKVWAADKTFEVTGDGYSPDGQIIFNNQKIGPDEDELIGMLLEVSAFCNNAKLSAPSDRIGRWTVLGDPTDGAFLVFAEKGDFNISKALAENPRIGLIPFNSQRRMMTSIHRNLDGKTTLYTKGAGEEVLKHCTKLLRDGDELPLTGEVGREIQREMGGLASDGFRVLALATKTLQGETEDASKEVEDMTFLGLAALLDPPRPKVEAAVREAKGAGIRVLMLTGDHEFTAQSIARSVGIVDGNPSVLTGHELEQMGDEALAGALEGGASVFARVSPEQKLRIVHILKSRGEVVGVTGDGVNDAPTLIEANVGIAIGAGGTDVARESADIVLLNNDFSSIVEGIRLGRSMFDNLRGFVHYVYTHNWAELFAFVVFVLLQTPLPLLVVQVLAIDLMLDVVPSLSLIIEPPEPDIMARPPRRGARVIDVSTLLRSLYLGVAVSACAVFWAFNVWGSGGWVLGSGTVIDPTIYARGTTVVMAGIMLGQVGNLFSARSSSLSAFRLSPLRNGWLFLGVGVLFAVMAAIVYVPLLQGLFGTAPLLIQDWLFLSLLAPMVLLLEELRKMFARRLRGRIAR